MKHVEGHKTTGTKIEPEPARTFVNSLVCKKNVAEEEGGYGNETQINQLQVAPSNNIVRIFIIEILKYKDLGKSLNCTHTFRIID